MQLRLLAIVIFWCFMQLAASTEYAISAEYITMQEGLSDNNVNSILKDRSGFIWFGTSDGLNRYDGFTIKSYFPSNSSLHVTSIYQCDAGYLWIASPNGLHLFNPITESFLAHIKLTPDAQDTINSISITGISGSIDNGLLLTTSSGIALLSFPDFTHNLNDFKIQWKNKNNAKGLTHDVFACITQTPDGRFWLGTNTNLIVSYNPITQQFHSFPLKRSNPNHAQFIVTSLTFIDNQLIASTIGHGIHILDPATGNSKVIAHQPHGNSTISHKDVYGVVKDSNSDYWVATWDGLDQLLELTPETKANHYNWDHPLFQDKLENRMISILADPSGVLWIGTHGGGAVKINLEKQYFRRIGFNSLYEVKDFTTDHFNNLYIALYHGGIKKTSLPLSAQRTVSFDQFTTTANPKRRISTDIVLSAATDESGNIWFGTLESSLLYYQPEKDIISELKVTPKGKKEWEGRIEALHIDRKGRFWLGTSNGLILYNRASNAFFLTQANPKIQYQLSGNYVRAILEDQAGDIWIGADKGLNKLIYQQADTFRFNQFNDLHTSSNQLDNKEVWALHQMPDGRIWIGYRSALGYYDHLHSAIHFLNKRDGLCHNFVTCLTHQDENDLWIGTNSGISRFNTQTLTFTNFYLANNLRAVHKTTDGQLIFGNNRGLLSFHPDSIVKNQFSPPTYITGIQIENHYLKVGETKHHKIVLPQSAPYTASIELHHPINSLAINYVGLSYLHQRANQYEYRMVNLQDDWIRVDGTQRTVSYNNLHPGKYRFEVRSANSDGIWNPQPALLNIIIHPAWYASWWGRLLLFFTITSLLIAIYKIRLKQVYRQKELALQSKELEHQLDIVRIERDKEHELANLKARFFTNISHELRTPLTLILAPVQELLKDTALSDVVRNRMTTVHQHALQLYHLISQLLDLRKTETGRMPLTAAPNNVVPLLQQIINQLKPFAQLKKITLLLNYTDPVDQVWLDVEKIQTVVSNLLSNAIKFSPEHATIWLTLKSSEQNCIISVKDNGPGIAIEEQEHIFQRFFQSPTNTNTGYAGSGIGLSLARELVLLHHGSLTVNSTPGQGAEFIISLPLGDHHLRADEKGQTQLREQSFPDEAFSISSDEAKLSSPLPSDRPKLLIVEDHEQLRRYLNSLLEDRFSIQNAGNGKEALDLLSKQAPDLIVSDIMMPVMDGYQLCETVKTEPHLCHIPVVLLTAKSGEQDLLDGLETGADDYITKPFTPELLIAKIDNLLKSRNLLKRYYSQKVTLASTDIEIEPHQEQFIRQAMEIVERNLTNAQFNATLLAEALNMSQPTLYRRIKAFTGDNIATFIRSIRIKQAAQLLKSGHYSVGETATKVGFSDTAYFRKCFTQQFGVTPSKYKGEG